MVHLGSTAGLRALGKKGSQERGLGGLIGQHLPEDAPAPLLRKQSLSLDHLPLLTMAGGTMASLLLPLRSSLGRPVASSHTPSSTTSTLEAPVSWTRSSMGASSSLPCSSIL